MRKYKLFCFPHAGGSTYLYCKWNKLLSHDIQLIPVEYCGRGERSREAFYPNYEAMICDLYEKFNNHINYGDKFIFFGHSLGAFVAYELAKQLELRGIKGLLQLYVSGTEGPKYHYFETKNKISHLSNDKFLKEIEKYGGFNEEIMEDKESHNYFLSILRNDFRIVETIPKQGYIHKLNTDIFVLNGAYDLGIDKQKVDNWTEATNKTCVIRYFPGHHFYIEKHYPHIVNLINKSVIKDVNVR